MHMNHSPGLPHLVSNDCRNHAREERVVTHTSDGQHFKAEQGPGKRGAEDGRKASTNTGHENPPAIFATQPEDMRQLIGKGASHLHRSTLTSHRCAKEF
ncbi:hypothetical protein SAMN05216190_13423 [Pseudomonas borbori]|uniref:Uncharacterized protein n=1 Tax=Pseudomonas borbori TaxID=289003 RepID=A0A1I5VYT3_9PSED|nr:hypothetical protein SAMN05216190_13423 [Pseudomonas borbori]